MRGLFLAAIGAAALALSGCGDKIELKTLDYAGFERLVAEHRGKVVVVDVWSTSCPPCMKEFPRLVALNKKYKSRGLECISLSLDFEGIGKPEEQAPKVLEFLRGQGAAFDNVLASEESDAMYKKLDAPSIPLVMVYDRQGKLRERFQEETAKNGEPSPKPLYDRVEALVEKLLEEPPAK